jgi:hypothetical protein
MAFFLAILYLKDNYVLRSLKFGVLKVTPMQTPTQNGKMKVLSSAFHHRTNLTPLLSSNLWSRNKTTSSEVWNLDSLGFWKGFWIFVKERCSWPGNGFIVFRRYNFFEKSDVRFILEWNFLNKTSNLNFTFGSCMGNSAKSLFYSVLFNKFHHRTNLIALFTVNLVLKR